jgi:hypothetical protein
MINMDPLKRAAPYLLFAAISALVLWYDQLTGDTSWYLIATKWWLNGLTIYQEILEPNPPLSFYLIVPPVFLAGITGLSAVLLLKLYVLTIAAVSLLWARRVFISSGRFSTTDAAWLTSLASIALLIVPLTTFGEREHFLILFAWPYVALSMVTNQNQPRFRPAMVGLYASFGFALKPYFLAIPIFLTVTQMIQRRSLRPAYSAQNLVILGFCILYVCTSYILHPAYFTKMIPQASLTYGAYKQDLMYILLRVIQPVVFIIIIRYWAGRLAKDGNTAGLFLINAAIAGVAAYLVQSKGWHYQTVPFLSFLLIAAGWVVYSLLKQQKYYFFSAFITVVSIWLILIPALNLGKVQTPASRVFASYFTCPRGQRTYQAFAANVWPGFPLAHVADARPVNRAAALWRFPGAVSKLRYTKDGEERKRLEALVQEARDDAINDLIRGKPQLIFLDVRERKTYFKGAKFSYIETFSQVPEFLPIWEKYSKAGHFGGFDIYRREGCGTGAE